jgi:hypothetical protein
VRAEVSHAEEERLRGPFPREALELGDGNDMFLVVEAGVEEGDEVVLDPLASIEEAQTEAAKTLEAIERQEPELSEI